MVKRKKVELEPQPAATERIRLVLLVGDASDLGNRIGYAWVQLYAVLVDLQVM